MSSRTRAVVMSISAPVIAFAIVGGFLGKVMAREDTYQHLKIFDDVVSLISSNYVEDVDIDKVMRGAMHGLADSPRSRQRVSHAGAGETGRERRAAAAGRRRPRAHPSVLSAASSPRATTRRRQRPACAPATTSARSTTCRRATCRSGKACARCAARRARKCR